MTTAERIYEWDEPAIVNPKEGGDYTVLPPGNYQFTITKLERARFSGSAKLGPCWKAILYVEVDGGSLGSTLVKHNLYLHSKCEGLLCAFFESIGFRKSGEPLEMRWDDVPGTTGWAKTGIRKYQDKDFVEILRFLPEKPKHCGPLNYATPDQPPTATTPTTATWTPDTDDIPF